MSQSETWTVKRLLEWTTDFFRKKGIETPRLEAEILLANAMSLKRIELYTSYETEPSEPQRALFRENVKRRGAGEPVAYLVGYKEFFSLSFQVDRNVLIPRPESEQLVLESLDILKSFPDGEAPKVCDIGTGSGAIAVAIAKNWPAKLPPPSGRSRITAVDIDPASLALATKNAQLNGVGDRIDPICCDLLEAVHGPFDLIVSNPPYVTQTEYEKLPPDVRNFEPKKALLAGPNGTEIIQRLIPQAWDKLTPGGRLLIEGSPMIVEKIAALLESWSDVRIIKDGNGQKRFVSAVKP